MRSKVHDILKVIGRDVPDPGAHMYHAADGAYDGGKVEKGKRHRIRKALHKVRMRATGMTDDIYGSKEVGKEGPNPHEQKV